MTFTYPWALLALLVIPVLIWRYRALIRADQERRDALARTGLVPAAAGATGTGRAGRRGRHLVPACLLATLALLILAAAGPAATLTQVHREGTVILAFDTSNSMRATDLQPDRLAAAKAAAYRFIDAQPRNIRIGVVAFSDTGNVTQSPIDDPRLVKSAVDRLGAHGGTSLGQGLFTSLMAIAGGKLAVMKRSEPFCLTKRSRSSWMNLVARSRSMGWRSIRPWTKPPSGGSLRPPTARTPGPPAPAISATSMPG